MTEKKQQVKIYRMSRGIKIFGAFAIPPLMVLLGWLLIELWMKSSSRQGVAEWLFVELILAAGFLFIVYAGISIFMWRLEIHPDRIRDAGIFRTREILIDDVRGFRVHQGSQFNIYPKSSNTKKIGASLYIERKSELLEWLDEKFKDLDFEDYEEEVEQVLHDPELGANEMNDLMFWKKQRKLLQLSTGRLLF